MPNTSVAKPMRTPSESEWCRTRRRAGRGTSWVSRLRRWFREAAIDVIPTSISENDRSRRDRLSSRRDVRPRPQTSTPRNTRLPCTFTSAVRRHVHREVVETVSRSTASAAFMPLVAHLLARSCEPKLSKGKARTRLQPATPRRKRRSLRDNHPGAARSWFPDSVEARCWSTFLVIRGEDDRDIACRILSLNDWACCRHLPAS